MISMKLKFNQKINSYFGMTKRNILLFFKDKTTLFFSMLSPLIVFMLYILFLKDAYLSEFIESLKGLEEYFDAKDVENICNAWLLSGVLGTSAITVSLNSLHVMVKDKEAKIDYDYSSSPISNIIVILSYFTGAFINTFIITGSILTIGLISLNLIGNLYLGIGNILLLYLLTALGCASSTIIMMIIVSFFKSASALGAFSGIVSAAIGFVVGAYIPLGSFSKTVQGILSLVPGSHITCLYRNLLMTPLANHIDEALKGIDNFSFSGMVNDVFALKLNMFEFVTSDSFMIIYSSASAVIALALNIIFYKKAYMRA